MRVMMRLPAVAVTRSVIPARARSSQRVQPHTDALARRFASRRAAPPGGSGQPQQPQQTPPPGVTKQMIAQEGKEILKLMIGGVALLSGLIASSGFVIESMKQVNPMAAPGSFVVLRDHEGKPVRVHYQKKGDGDVTVIFDGGVGETSFDWDKVAQQVGEFATVLSIDRPGLGFSMPGQHPRTAMQAASEYAEVLEKLNVPRDVILVAHGAGGYNMRQLAEDLENASSPGIKCQGLVLVDSLQENLREELESVSEPVKDALAVMDKNGDTILRLARIGLVRLITLVQHEKSVAKYSPEALPYVEFFTPTPAHRKAANAENAAIPLTEQRFRDAPPAKKFEFPCVVLSHGRADMFDGMKVQSGVDARMVAMLEYKWQQAQRELAKAVGAVPAVQIIVPDAGHCIHHEKPEEITKIVRALVNESHSKGDKQGLDSLREGSCPI